MKPLYLCLPLFLAVLASACDGDATEPPPSDACEEYAAAAEAKFNECGLTTEDGETSEEYECTDAAETLAECLTPCIEDVSCEAFDSESEGYADAAKSYSDCVAACTW